MQHSLVEVLAKWMDRPDWSLLGPLLNPNLPADHELRRLVAEPPPRPTPDAKAQSKGELAARRLVAAAEEARNRALDRRKSLEAAAAAEDDVSDRDNNTSRSDTPSLDASPMPRRPPMALGCTTGATATGPRTRRAE